MSTEGLWVPGRRPQAERGRGPAPSWPAQEWLPSSSPHCPISSHEISCSWRRPGRFLPGKEGAEDLGGADTPTSPNGSSQVSGPNAMFTDSQEIQEIRVTFVTTLNHQEASGGKGVPPFLPPALAPSLVAGSLEQCSQGTRGSGGPPRG